MSIVQLVKLAWKSFEPANGGDESLSPIIFLHGLTSSKEEWGKIPQKISDGANRKAYALDARNHGDSEYTDEYNFDMNVDDLFHFMDSMEIQKAILVGHSMGGVTSIKAALKNPERIEMIFVEDMYVKKIPQLLMHYVSNVLKSWVQIVEIIPSHLCEEEAIKYAVDIMFSKLPSQVPFLGSKEDMYNWKLCHRTSDGNYFVKFNRDVVFKAMENTNALMTDCVGQYDGPAYFLYGEVSTLQVQNEEDQIKNHFPKATLIGFEKASHFIHSMFPDEFCKTILQRIDN